MPNKPTRKKSITKPIAHPHAAVTHKVLGIIDDAADLLKKGVRTTSNETEKARALARKKALTLLNQATAHLDDALKQGSSTVRKGLKKL